MLWSCPFLALDTTDIEQVISPVIIRIIYHILLIPIKLSFNNKAESIYNDEDECDDVADDDLEASPEEDDEVVRILSITPHF